MLVIALPLALKAQSNYATIHQINTFKMDESLIYGEASSSNENTAYDYALSDLLPYINELRSGNGYNKKLDLSYIRSIAKPLIHFDGKQYNVCLFVVREQCLSDVSHIEIPESLTSADSKFESKEPIVQDKPENSSVSKETSLEERFTPLPNDILTTLCNQDNWIEIKGFLSTYKNQGRLRETGFSTNPSDIPIDSYRILIDERYGILAILAPKNRSDLINIKTNQLDKESNYSNCKVIVWFKL